MSGGRRDIRNRLSRYNNKRSSEIVRRSNVNPQRPAKLNEIAPKTEQRIKDKGNQNSFIQKHLNAYKTTPKPIEEKQINFIRDLKNNNLETKLLSGNFKAVRGEAVDTNAIFKITYDSNLQALSGFAETSDWSNDIVFSEEMPSLISWNSYDRKPFYEHIKMGGMTENVATHSISSTNNKEIAGFKIFYYTCIY